ncbi:GMC oxidoreductase [Lentithecium fluviatile CBS 122367]|uniref:GMC oxidoreductase n=1 Tax=Lentithecium fluviatile CBS 122367 TaxID=1168545 RepID=A0A6G1JNR0_9PLEO|nr:GMC oxidoreductase [Lentithecium fluviatile CBS 122367]
MSTESFITKAYDYIATGGSTAGLVVAACLSKDPNVTVGVIEAEGNRLDDPLIDGPSLFIRLWDKPEYDWCFKAVPQNGTAGRDHGWVRGKVLGGSSAVNSNMFSMASHQDLGNWKELENEGWGFEDLAPYYRKLETINDKYVDPLLRGTSGPIQVCAINRHVLACYPTPKDPRTGSALGGFNQLTAVDPKTLRRSYSAREYYQPNIDLEKSDSRGAKATGVSTIVDEATHFVKANKEVIICGGVVSSPQILELSGIGSPVVLPKAGIYIVVDNPNIGENLNDHTATGIPIKVKDEYPTAEVLVRNPEITQQAREVYIAQNAGPFTNAPTTAGFASLQMIDPNLTEPEKHVLSYLAEHRKQHPNADPAGRNELLAHPILDPKEAVMQTLFSMTGFDMRNCDKPHPKIDNAYFSHPLDLDVCARGILHSFKLAQIEPLRSKLRLDDNGDPIVNPGDGFLPRTLEEAKKAASENTKGAVVDSQLKVYGTSNVRVVDASIFPLHVQDNIVSLVYAVAEKAADLIKG